MSDDRWTTASSEIGAVWAESQRPQRPISTATLPQLVKAGDLRELKRALAAEPERVNEVDEDGSAAGERRNSFGGDQGGQNLMSTSVSSAAHPLSKFNVNERPARGPSTI